GRGHDCARAGRSAMFWCTHEEAGVDRGGPARPRAARGGGGRDGTGGGPDEARPGGGAPRGRRGDVRAGRGGSGRGRRTGAAGRALCLFEVGQLEERGRVSLGLPFERWCDLVEEVAALLLLPLERAHVSEARSLPTLRDPFDRLIAGTAVALGLPLITADSRI